jgi:hypothetical protein
MTKYKTFEELKIDDPLYIVEISNISCKFKQYKITHVNKYISNNKIVEAYIEGSPLPLNLDRNQSKYMEIIFTTKEEAIESAKQQINDKIKEFSEQIVYFSNKLANIDDIEFR